VTQWQEQLKKYALLSLKIGINLQKGQDLVIRATVDAKDFVREVVEQPTRKAPKMFSSIGMTNKSRGLNMIWHPWKHLKNFLCG
jgi:leucyl aminopeptidase (aminopeptidase T)